MSVFVCVSSSDFVYVRALDLDLRLRVCERSMVPVWDHVKEIDVLPVGVHRCDRDAVSDVL